MRAVITVIGKDKIGIIAGISAELANAGINILDISQTVMQEYFVMIMLVDLTDAIEDSKTVQAKLAKKGNQLGVQVKMQREEIFDAMHQV